MSDPLSLDGPKVMRRWAASYGQMTTAGTLNDGSTTRYGFGLGVGDLEGHARVSHGGGINGFDTMLSHYPEADLDVVVRSNTEGAHPRRIAETIARWALGIEVPAVLDEALSAEQLAAYEGVYELATGFELSVVSKDGQLFSQATGQGEFRLRARGTTRLSPLSMTPSKWSSSWRVGGPPASSSTREGK